MQHVRIFSLKIADNNFDLMSQTLVFFFHKTTLYLRRRYSKHRSDIPRLVLIDADLSCFMPLLSAPVPSLLQSQSHG